MGTDTKERELQNRLVAAMIRGVRSEIKAVGDKLQDYRTNRAAVVAQESLS